MAKADKALSARRTEDVLRIRLDGAEWWDVVQFVREKEKESGSAWFVGKGATPLSEAMIRKYQERADKLMEQAHEKSRKKLFRRHLAQRRNLYSRAVLTGDIAAALRCLDSEAHLLGLHEPRIPTPPDGSHKDNKTRVAEAVRFYEAVVARIDVPLEQRLKAQQAIERLLGLDCLALEERLKALEDAVKEKQP